MVISKHERERLKGTFIKAIEVWWEKYRQKYKWTEFAERLKD